MHIFYSSRRFLASTTLLAAVASGRSTSNKLQSPTGSSSSSSSTTTRRSYEFLRTQIRTRMLQSDGLLLRDEDGGSVYISPQTSSKVLNNDEHDALLFMTPSPLWHQQRNTYTTPEDSKKLHSQKEMIPDDVGILDHRHYHHHHRELQQYDFSAYTAFCESLNSFAESDQYCSCYEWAKGGGIGSFGCLLVDTFCYAAPTASGYNGNSTAAENEICYSARVSVDSNWNGNKRTMTFCNSFSKPHLHEYCLTTASEYSFNSYFNDINCTIVLDGITCNSCTIQNECTGVSQKLGDFDCTNTGARTKGNFCEAGNLPFTVDGAFITGADVQENPSTDMSDSKSASPAVFGLNSGIIIHSSGLVLAVGVSLFLALV